MSEPAHKSTGYNTCHVMKADVDPDLYAGTSLPYKAASRIVNVLEDLHFQMQKPAGERFNDYPIEDFEVLDTYIRDNMANLALSLETRSLSKKEAE